MDDFRSMARHPEFRRQFEKLLYLAAQCGDADLVAERLSWGIDPNCSFAKGRTPLIANVRGLCLHEGTIRLLLERGADPSLADESGLTVLDYARRKLVRLQARPRRRHSKSPSLDENNQLYLTSDEQDELDQMRREFAGTDLDYLRIWWQERWRAARRVFNDLDQVQRIVGLLEQAGGG